MFAPGTACSGIMTHNKRQIKIVILQIIQNINEKCKKELWLGKIMSQSTFSVVFHSIIFLFIAFPEVVNAVQTQDQLVANFDSKLEITTDNIAARVLGSKKRVVITVIDLFNHETQERDTQTDLLEEKFTDSLYKKLPDQVIPYFEIVYLRLEWRSTFPEIKHDPLTEDIAKLTNADWLLTGTHQTNDGLLSVSLELYDLKSGNLLWQTVVGINSTIENDLEKNAQLGNGLEEELAQKFEQNSSLFTTQNDTQLPSPLFPQITQDPALEHKKTGEYEGNIVSALMIETVKERQEYPDGMVFINEGEFLMGSDLGDEDELPDHLVFVKSFYLDQHEVTNGDYSKCVECTRGHGGFDTIEPQQPVVYVDWKNADAFCQFQNKRLPTESEWEYAARAGSEEKYSFGDNISLLETYAWLKTNTVDKGLWGAKTVSSKKANKWGLHDLYGNVMEWVQNYYKPNYFAYVRQSDNSNDLNVPENEEYPLRVVRGGAWGGLHGAGTPEGLRSAKRYAFVEWTRSFQIGFRCAMDIPEKN